jgi:hypothetical protein
MLQRFAYCLSRLIYIRKVVNEPKSAVREMDEIENKREQRLFLQGLTNLDDSQLHWIIEKEKYTEWEKEYAQKELDRRARGECSKSFRWY